MLYVKRGFTLVELLVVIAIISILAGIVVPNLVGALFKSRNARAVSEIRSVDTALGAMLADAGVARFRDFLNPQGRSIVQGFAGGGFGINNLVAAQGFYNEMMYDLLRNGRNSSFVHLDQEIKGKLGTSYMNLGQDPWDNQYRFWMGPVGAIQVFRSKRLGEPYTWDAGNRAAASQEVPGQPPADGLYGYPAPRDLPMYVFSLGPNQLVDAMLAIQDTYGQEAAFLGGGDDINNWDSEAGWEFAPQQ